VIIRVLKSSSGQPKRSSPPAWRFDRSYQPQNERKMHVKYKFLSYSLLIVVQAMG
jgi:hypothetical protein